MSKTRNVVASVHQRLLNQSRDTKRPFMEVLQYYAMERFLLRMSKSKYAHAFILKGALLLRIVGIHEVRPTKDIDFLGLESYDIETLKNVIRDCCEIDVEDDGLDFRSETINGVEIRSDQAYQGVRITFIVYLGKSKIQMQIDVGFGDVISPKPLLVDYPVILQGEAPRLYVYSLESAIAEKYHAMIFLDLANSRMKDFYDIWYLQRNHNFKMNVLAHAIEQTFNRRKAHIPKEIPTALSDIFFQDEGKISQWKAFKSKITDIRSPETLEDVIIDIRKFIWPVNKWVLAKESNDYDWIPGNDWIISDHSNPKTS